MARNISVEVDFEDNSNFAQVRFFKDGILSGPKDIVLPGMKEIEPLWGNGATAFRGHWRICTAIAKTLEGAVADADALDLMDQEIACSAEIDSDEEIACLIAAAG